MMGEALLGLLSQPLWVFMTVLARVSPVLMLTPPTRSSSVPMRVRAGIALGMSALLTPVAFDSATRMPADLLNLSIPLACEVYVGVSLGSVIMSAVTCLQIAGQSIGHLAGFDLATALDPSSEEEMPVISNMLGWMAMAILLLLGGHRELIECCLESYQRYPAGAVVFDVSWLEEIVMLTQHTFEIGLRAAAPLATALLLSNLVTALLARTLPQLNVLAVGFNINALALLMLLFMSMGSVSWVFQRELAVWIDSCHRIASGGP